MSWYTVPAFIITLSLLIVIHEYGHYRVAVACGVKVLRFSLGFGKPLFSWKRGKDQTEFSIAPIPFGGYVRMLDEREAPVDSSELHRAFNRQPLLLRTLIVLAGPVANLILAVALFALIAAIGVQEPKAILAAPAQDSMLQQAGLNSGDEITGIAIGSGTTRPVISINDFRMSLMEAAFSQKDAYLNVTPSSGNAFTARIPLSEIDSASVDETFLHKIGYRGFYARFVIASVVVGGAAERAGLQQGDLIESVNGEPVSDINKLVELIQNSNSKNILEWIVERNGSPLSLNVLPDVVKDENNAEIGKIGVAFGLLPEMVTIHHGILGSFAYGFDKTWSNAVLTLKLIGKMLVGRVSVQNLSGPITIADLAGKTVSYGWVSYLTFLAVISLSLGVLNLLPLPVLDGGHLLFYMYEGIRGKPLPDKAMVVFQYFGMFCLILLMLVATYNDIIRLFLR